MIGIALGANLSVNNTFYLGVESRWGLCFGNNKTKPCIACIIYTTETCMSYISILSTNSRVNKVEIECCFLCVSQFHIIALYCVFSTCKIVAIFSDINMHKLENIVNMFGEIFGLTLFEVQNLIIFALLIFFNNFCFNFIRLFRIFSLCS